MAESLSIKWFAGYYAVFGLLLLATGIWLMANYEKAYSYLHRCAEEEQIPHLLRTILKYWFLFTLPCLVLSFMPFSWTELLFSVWSLLMVYVTGIQLVHWQHRRLFVLEHPHRTKFVIRTAGAILLSVSFIIFLLGYLLIKRTV